MKIVQLSDTHLLGKDGSLFGIDPTIRLQKALNSIERYHSDTAFVVITGDIANSADENAYKRLKDMISGFSKGILLIPGNHDNKTYMKRYFDIPSEKIYNEKLFLFLDSTIEGEEFGGMSEDRLQSMQKSLEKYKDKDVYLFMHHFPLTSHLAWMDRYANFRTSQKFFAVLEKYKNVKHIFCGHLHRIIQANYKHISISCTRSTTFQVAYKPDSKDDYLTNEEHPTYCVAYLKENSILLHHHEFLSEDLIYPGEQW